MQGFHGVVLSWEGQSHQLNRICHACFLFFNPCVCNTRIQEAATNHRLKEAPCSEAPSLMHMLQAWRFMTRLWVPHQEQL